MRARLLPVIGLALALGPAAVAIARAQPSAEPAAPAPPRADAPEPPAAALVPLIVITLPPIDPSEPPEPPAPLADSPGPAAPPADSPGPTDSAPPAASQSLGSYEQQALAHALGVLRLERDPAPDGKRVGRIHVVNQDVFSNRDGFLQAFNIFHRTTRDEIIRREVLLRPGQAWSQELVEETERKLRDPIFTTLALIAPVRSPRPGHVDLLVVTRDVWSLRLNSSFEFQESQLTQLRLSLSENNFLGWRKTAAFQFLMDQGSYSVGPLYLDKNVAGKRLQMLAQAAAIFARETSELEGSRSRLVVTRPLWTLASKWGAGIELSQTDLVTRRFLGTELRAVDLAATPEDDMLPEAFRFRTLALEVGGDRQLGDRVKHRISAGYRLTQLASEVLPEFPGDDDQRAAFEQEVLPRSERVSAVFLGYTAFTPRFVKLRNIDGYDLPEDLRLGPAVAVEAAPALSALGSDQDFARLAATASYTHPWDDGFARAAASAATRALLSGGGDRFVDNDVSASVAVVSPARYGPRLIGQLGAAARFRDTANANFEVGGQNGLRAYPVGAFRGDFRVLGNLELRTQPIRILFSRAGLLAFYDVGHAADRVGDLRLKQDVGVGVRALIPQLSTLVYRLDVAVPLVGAEIPGLGLVRAGLPGLRVSAGVGQVF